MKLPHILSESSQSSTPLSHLHNHPSFTYNARATYESTPSQTSSVWKWENFYPPSPPSSEFFNDHNDEKDNASVYSHFDSNNGSKKFDTKDEIASVYSNNFENRSKKMNREEDNDSIYSKESLHHKKNSFENRSKKINGEEDDDNGSVYSTKKKSYYPKEESVKSYQSDKKQKQRSHHQEFETDCVDEETDREEVKCSEWGDHYSTTTSTSSEGEGEEGPDADGRSEMGTRSHFGSSVHTESMAPPYRPMEAPSKFTNDAGSSASRNTGGGDMKIVVRHRDLGEIVAAIQEYFDKAAAAGEQVSEALETGRAQLDQSFRQLKKTVYHSSGVLSNLSSSWTSKPPLAVKYRFEPSSIDEPGGLKSLCSTLEDS